MIERDPNPNKEGTVVDAERLPLCASCRNRDKKRFWNTFACSSYTEAGTLCPGIHSTIESRGHGKFTKFRVNLKQKDNHSPTRRRGMYHNPNKLSSTRSDSEGRKLSKSPSAPLSNTESSLRARVTALLPSTRSLKTGALPTYPFFYYIPKWIGLAPALDKAAACICFAAERKDEIDTAGCQTRYIAALQSLQNALYDSATLRAPETLAAIAILYAFEMFCDIGHRGFVKHVRGLSTMIELMGPEAFEAEMSGIILESSIGEIIFDCIISGRPCFLSQPQWVARIEKNFNTDEPDSPHLSSAELDLWRTLYSFPQLLEDYAQWQATHRTKKTGLLSKTNALYERTLHIKQEITSWRLTYLVQLEPGTSDLEGSASISEGVRDAGVPMIRQVLNIVSADFLILINHFIYQLATDLSWITLDDSGSALLTSSEIATYPSYDENQSKAERCIDRQGLVEEAVHFAKVAGQTQAVLFRIHAPFVTSLTAALKLKWERATTPYLIHGGDGHGDAILEAVSGIWPLTEVNLGKPEKTPSSQRRDEDHS